MIVQAAAELNDLDRGRTCVAGQGELEVLHDAMHVTYIPIIYPLKPAYQFTSLDRYVNAADTYLFL